MVHSVVLNSNVDLGKRISSWRALRRLKQQDVADACDVSAPAVSMWETGAATPKHEHLLLIVQLFGISMAKFYGHVPGQKGK